MSARELCWELVEQYRLEGVDMGELVEALSTIINTAESEVYAKAAEVERDLNAKIVLLKAEIAALRVKEGKVISINLDDLIQEGSEFGENFIQFVKYVRDGEGAVRVSGGWKLGLYEAKCIAEFVFVYLGCKGFQNPSRGEKVATMSFRSSYRVLKENILELLKANMPDFEVRF